MNQKARLLALVRTPNRAAKQDEAAMTLSRAKHLTRMPWERRPIECDEHKTGFGARHQHGIVQAKPGSVLPSCNVNNGKCPVQTYFIP
jgi:hypothetical protein